MLFPWKISGLGYLILNFLRILNVISLSGVIAAAVVMLVKTFIVNGYFFFDSLTHVVTIFFSIFLILSEFPMFERIRSWYRINFPLLSYESGVAPVGLLLIIDGALVLSNLNNNSLNDAIFGHTFYSIIIAGGILPFVSGILNIIASFVFSNRKMRITSRMIRKFGSTGAERVTSDTLYPNGRSHSDIERAMSQNSRAPIMRPGTGRSGSVYSVTTNGRHVDQPAHPAPAHYGVF